MRSPARIMWAARLHSAVRAALACAIVGGATLYGPTFITDQIKFPAFSYVTVILITFDATVLGGSLRGCWHAFCATAQVVPPAMAGRWLAGDTAGLSIWMAALAAAAASFVVVLPESTHLTAKRIALGQLVLACTEAVITSDESSNGFMHPLHIAASTALGALASVSALLLPFPRLAHYEVEKLRRVYAENARERMNLYLRAFKANDNRTKTELLLQAKPFAETGNKLLQNITILQEVVWWERPWSHYLKHDLISIEDRLISTELTMRGIEYSLVYSQTSCTPDNQEQLSSVLDSLSCQLHHEIEHAVLPTEAAPHEKRRGSTFIEENLSSQLAPIQNKHEWLCFFFSCIDILLDETKENRKPQTQPQKAEFTIIGKIKNWIVDLSRSDRLESALKCSLSLGLAVLSGLMLERENGCWASLTLATGFSVGKQPFFTTANSRAQGTAVGSVYGVICCFIFRYLELRLVSLLPWIVFSVFIRHSRMYGQTGGISAAIGASLILGRKKYGPPAEFAIARITAVFVGLLCLLLVELLIQPNRAATLAKRQLYLTLEALKNSLNETGFRRFSKILQAREKRQRKLETLVQELRKSVADADSEPDFWCLPFQTTCYKKVVASLSCIENMLYFLQLNLDLVSETLRHELNEQVHNELELLQESVNSLLKYLDKASSIKSRDIEAGKSEKVNALVVEYEEKENEKRRHGERVVRCIGAIGFCIGSIRKEIDNVDICVKEIVQWENFSTK